MASDKTVMASRSSRVTLVLKTAMSLLVKDLDEILDAKDDLTDETSRDWILNEIGQTESKLKKKDEQDLKKSIEHFRNGIEYLFKQLIKVNSGDDSSATTQTAAETAEKHLDEEFEKARLKATEAFNNETLSTCDRIRAMAVRVAARVLEKVDNPDEALEACMLYMQELHFMPAVKKIFTAELARLKPGHSLNLKGKLRQKIIKRIISGVYKVNRLVYDVMQTVVNDSTFLKQWPCVEAGPGEEKFNPLSDERVANWCPEWKVTAKVIIIGCNVMVFFFCR